MHDVRAWLFDPAHQAYLPTCRTSLIDPSDADQAPLQAERRRTLFETEPARLRARLPSDA
jgi:hypothetical protein